MQLTLSLLLLTERRAQSSRSLLLCVPPMARRLAAAAVAPLSRCLTGGGPAATAAASRQAATANSNSFGVSIIFGSQCRPAPSPPPASSLLATLFPPGASSRPHSAFFSSSFSSSAYVASPPSSSSSSAAAASWPPLSKIPRWWDDEEEGEGDSSGQRRRRRPGPRAAKFSALPFTVSRAQAERTYRAFHAAHALLPSRAPTPSRVDEALLPFWCVAAVGVVRLRGAAVGFDRHERVYDPLSRTWRTEVRTRWHSVELDRRWEAEYLPDAPGMCVYASFRYAASDAAAASPARGAAGATLLRRGSGIPVSEAVSRPAPLDDDDDGGGDFSSSSSSSPPPQRAVDPFEMPPAEAVRIALAAARAAEVSRAAAALRHEFRADRVAAVDLTFDPSVDDGSGIGGGGVAASPLYVPAFVFHWSHYGTRVVTVVSGSAPGEVAGDRALDAARVAAAAAVASDAAMAFAGGPPAWLAGGAAAGGGVLFGGMGAVAANALGWALGLAAPAAAAALAAHYAPLLRSKFHAAAAARGAARSAAAAREKGWDAEWVESGASEAAEAARRRGERARGQRQGSSSSSSRYSSDEPHRPGPAGDPRRYYSTLGVAPTASQREISAAFRGAALRSHPDRLPAGASEAERAAASRGFREIVEAYGVLRDPGKRAAYDRGEI